MDYKIENIEIKTAKNSSEYVLLTLVNADDEWDEPFNVPVWNDIQIARYKALLASPEVMGDVNKIPENRKLFKYGFWEEVELPEPMYRLWGSTVTSTRIVNGQPVQETHEEGTPVCDRLGNPVLYTKFMVFTKKTFDNNLQQLVPAKGWGLVERANQMIARQFSRPTASQVNVQQTAQVQVAPQAQPTVAPQPAQQPAPQAQPQQAQAPAPGTVTVQQPAQAPDPSQFAQANPLPY